MSDRASRILLVEDNRGDAALVKRTLGDEVEITVAPTLEEGISSLGAGFDVVLLDLALPDSTGLDTVKKMRSAAPEIAIVVLTGLEDEGLDRRCVEAGATDCVLKGAHMRSDLRRCLSNVLD